MMLAVAAVLCVVQDISSHPSVRETAGSNDDVELAPGVEQNDHFFHDSAFYSKSHKAVNDFLFHDNEDSADDKVTVEHKLLPSFAVDALEKSTSDESDESSEKASSVEHQAKLSAPKKVTYHASAEEETDEAQSAAQTEDPEITQQVLQQIKRIPHKLPEGNSYKETKRLLPKGQDYSDTAFPKGLPDPAFGDKADSVFTKAAVASVTKWKDMGISEIVKMAEEKVKKKKEA